MKTRTLFILVAAFVALGVVAMIPWLTGDDARPGNGKLGLSKYDESSVSKIVITKKGEKKPVTLEKRNGIWMYGKDKANLDEIKGFFRVMKDSEVGDLVSKNKANHKNFAVTPSDGTVLDLTTSDGTTTYIVGNGGDVVRMFFMRKSGEDNVYEVTGDLPGRLTQPAATWVKPQK